MTFQFNLSQFSPSPIAYSMTNHLPDGKDMRDMQGPGGYSEVAGPGTGFGLGVSVVTNLVPTQQIGSVGTCSWGVRQQTDKAHVQPDDAHVSGHYSP
jgi:hypothetical protein